MSLILSVVSVHAFVRETEALAVNVLPGAGLPVTVTPWLIAGVYLIICFVWLTL